MRPTKVLLAISFVAAAATVVPSMADARGGRGGGAHFTEVVHVSMEAVHTSTAVVRAGTVEGHVGPEAVAITVAAIAEAITVLVGELPRLV